jgi:hypothetical protein
MRDGKDVSCAALCAVQVANFFITYVLLRTFTGFPLYLLRPGPLLISNFLRWIAKSPRQTRKGTDWARTNFDYGKEPVSCSTGQE